MSSNRTATFLSCLAFAAVAVFTPNRAPAADETITLGINRPAQDQVRVNWSDADTANDGYALMSAASLLDTVWRYADSADAWPSAATNWTGGADGTNHFFRVRKAHRGRLVSAVSQGTTSAFLIQISLNSYGITNITATYDVTTYKLTYETFDHRGLSVLATAALCVPSTVTPLTVPLVCYQHGTIFKSTDAPSNAGAGDQFFGIAMASEGYAVVQPDYLGLGTESPPLHPYLHARSEAVACVDGIRSGLAEIAQLGTLTHSGQLFLSGYSQGGHATLALQRELETRHAAEFTVTASAPMAGPHDLSGTMKDLMLSDAPYSSPSFLPYVLFGLNAVYHLFESPSDVLTAPYDSTLLPLFDGAHSGSEIDAAMPSVPKLIFTSGFLSDFTTNSNNVFRAALHSNDTYRDWVPGAPTRFYHCAGDTTVPPANSQVAYNDFISRGATLVSIEDPAPTANHSTGANPCFMAAKAWFDTMKSP